MYLFYNLKNKNSVFKTDQLIGLDKFRVQDLSSYQSDVLLFELANTQKSFLILIPAEGAARRCSGNIC